MAERSLKIRVSAEDAGVGEVMRRLAAETQKFVAKVEKPVLGPAIKPRFDLQESLVRGQMARMLQQIRADTEKADLRIRAKVIVDDARTRVFGGPETKGPLRPVSRSAEEQAFRNAQADFLRAGRQETQAQRMGLSPVASARSGADTGVAPTAAAAAQNVGNFTSYAQAGQQALSKIGRGLMVIEAASKGVEMAAGVTEMIVSRTNGGYKEQVSAAEKMRGVIADIPIIGTRILAVGEFINKYTIDLVTGEKAYVEQLRLATAEQDKQIQRMADRATRQKDAIKSARDIAQSVGTDVDPNRTPAQIAQAKIADERKRLAEALKGEGMTKNGKLTATGEEIKAEGEKRIRNEEIAAAREAGKIRLDAAAEAERIQSEHQARMRGMANEAQIANLRDQKQELAARVVAIQASADEEMRTIAARRDKEQEAYGVTDPRSAAARQRASEEMQAVQNLAAGRIRDEQKQAADAKARDDADRLDQQRRFARQAADGQAKIAADRLRQMGQEHKAEKVMAGQGYLDRLQEIRDDYEKQMREHAERAPELRQQAAQLAAQAGDEYRTQLDQINRDSARERSQVRVGVQAEESRGGTGRAGVMGERYRAQIAGELNKGEEQKRTAKAAEETAASVKRLVEIAERSGNPIPVT